jgi:hypothetical protein
MKWFEINSILVAISVFDEIVTQASHTRTCMHVSLFVFPVFEQVKCLCLLWTVHGVGVIADVAERTTKGGSSV